MKRRKKTHSSSFLNFEAFPPSRWRLSGHVSASCITSVEKVIHNRELCRSGLVLHVCIYIFFYYQWKNTEMTCLWYTSINNKFSIMIIKRRKNNEQQWLD